MIVVVVELLLVEQNAWIYIQNLYEIDPDAEPTYEVELEAVIPDEDNFEDWEVVLEIGGTRQCTGYYSNTVGLVLFAF